jgi:hypothetical protein
MRDAKPAVTEPSGSPENLERFTMLCYAIEHGLSAPPRQG